MLSSHKLPLFGFDCLARFNIMFIISKLVEKPSISVGGTDIQRPMCREHTFIHHQCRGGCRLTSWDTSACRLVCCTRLGEQTYRTAV